MDKLLKINQPEGSGGAHIAPAIVGFFSSSPGMILDNSLAQNYDCLHAMCLYLKY